MQLLQQSLSLFANLICSSADLSRNRSVREAAGYTPQEALLTGAQDRRLHRAKIAIAANRTGIKPPTMTQMR
ncbi:hypothetical protein XI09_03825 [Bradyrhizobium sp. CCBAU 11386]|nr:hypothetical protein [Bradyrhizobium sp. CCBAU 11386]